MMPKTRCLNIGWWWYIQTGYANNTVITIGRLKFNNKLSESVL